MGKIKEMTLSEIAEEVGESREMIWYRNKNGISFDLPNRFKESDLIAE